MVMLETGMRCGEVYRIRRDEVFIEKSYLQVTERKTKSSARRVHLSEKSKQILSARLKRFDGVFLFPQNETDGKNASKTIDHIHRKVARRLKFNFRLYDFRHTFATRAGERRSRPFNIGFDAGTREFENGHALRAPVGRKKSRGHPKDAKAENKTKGKSSLKTLKTEK
jgi:integrase